MVIVRQVNGPLGKLLLAIDRMDDRRFNIVCLAILGVALLVRLVIASKLTDIDPHTAQIWEYGDIARTSLGHPDLVRVISLNGVAYTVKTAFMSPLLVYAWEALFNLFGVTKTALAIFLAFNIAGSVAIVWQTRILAALAGFSRIAVLASAVIMTFMPTFAYTASIYHALNFYLPLLLGSCIVAYRLAQRPTLVQALLLGFLAGLAALVRAEFIVLEAGIFIGAWLTHKSTRLLAASVILAALTIIPWTIRNELVLHRFVPVANTMGYNLWKGFNPETNGSSGDEDLVRGWEQRQAAAALQRLKPSPYLESDVDDVYKNIAVTWIEHHPLALIPLSAKKLVLFWTIDWLDPTITLRPLYLASVIPVSLFGFCGIMLAFRRRSTFDKIAFSLFLSQCLATILYSTAVRYRMNAEPLLAVYAGNTIAFILARLRGVSQD